MQTTDPKLHALMLVTLTTRLTADLERLNILPRGWTATTLRDAARSADRNMEFAKDPALHQALAALMRQVADFSLQPIAPTPTAAHGSSECNVTCFSVESEPAFAGLHPA